MNERMEAAQPPKRPDRKATSDSPKLTFGMPSDVRQRLKELQASVRAVGHSWPSQRTLISALILDEQRRGEELERDLLVPFRLGHPDAE